VTTIRTLAFAAPDGSSWGTAWLPCDQASAALAYRIGTRAGVADTRLEAAAADEPWRVQGAGVSLVFTPAGATGHGRGAETGIDSMDQLCAVDGRLELDEDASEISCTGWRSTLGGDVDLSAIDSFRHASAWFDPTHGLSLLALRPRKARGQDADLMAASLLEREPTPHVADPRLSTTYDAAGLPARVGLELWLESESSDEEPEEDSEHQFPRRAAGESIGPGVDWELAGFKLHAVLLRWHSQGDDGAGVYLLGQRE
jgi:hypothetical protein